MGKLKSALKNTTSLKHSKPIPCKISKNAIGLPSNVERKRDFPIHMFSDGTRSIYPLTDQSKILIIGDGNFSYSCSLLKIYEGTRAQIFATCYDSQELLYEKYADDKKNVELLLADTDRCRVLFGVNCSELGKIKQLRHHKFSRIIFNFPHAGKGIKDRNRNIMENQKLLQAFFTGCKSILNVQQPDQNKVCRNFYKTIMFRSNQKMTIDFFTEFERNLKEARVFTPKKIKIDKKKKKENNKNGKKDNSEDEQEDEVSLNQQTAHNWCEEQPEIHVTIKLGDPYDDWNIKKIAHSCDFSCKESFDFLFEKYPSYSHKRSIGDTIIGSNTLTMTQSENDTQEAKNNIDHIIDGKKCKTWIFIPTILLNKKAD